MMQIETIIINTSLIQITEKSIPENFLKANTNSSMCNENQLNLNLHENLKKNYNETSPKVFEPLRKTQKFPSFNTLDFLKANSKK